MSKELREQFTEEKKQTWHWSYLEYIEWLESKLKAVEITVEEAGIIAVGISEHLEAQEQSFFIAGFQECIKYLNELKKI